MVHATDGIPDNMIHFINRLIQQVVKQEEATESSETTEKVPSSPNQLFFWGTEMYNEAKKDRYKPFDMLPFE